MIFSFQRTDRYSRSFQISRGANAWRWAFGSCTREPRDATEQNKIKQIFYRLWIFI